MIQPTKTAATRVSANTRTSTTKSRDSMVDFLQRSTIYKRHQARLVKNMEKPHDPRSKAVRVLAGLPGFRALMVPPSEASQAAQQQQQQQQQIAMKDETIFQTQPQSSSSSTTSIASSTASSTQPQATVPIHLILTAGVAGAVAEVCYGSTTISGTKKCAGMQSPFQNAQMMAARQQQAERRAALPFVNEHGSLSIFRFHTAMAGHSPLAPSSWSSSFFRGTAAGKAQVVAGASSACFLFGTKALVSSLLAEEQQQDSSNNTQVRKQHVLSATSLVSSAMAGAMVAGVSTLQSTPINFLKVPTPSLFMTTLPRHVLGATLYFSSYEAFQKFFVSSKNSTTSDHNDKNHSSISAVAISGATAGALYQMALLQGTCTTRTPRMVTTTPPRLLVRAAPAHALLFVAYEWAQGNL